MLRLAKILRDDVQASRIRNLSDKRMQICKDMIKSSLGTVGRRLGDTTFNMDTVKVKVQDAEELFGKFDTWQGKGVDKKCKAFGRTLAEWSEDRDDEPGCFICGTLDTEQIHVLPHR